MLLRRWLLAPLTLATLSGAPLLRAQVQASPAAPAVSTGVGAEPIAYVYREVGGSRLKAFVFLPKGNAPKRPAILLFHGGAWQLGDATWMFDRAKAFAAMGLVAIAIDYRLANEGRSPIESVEDACAAFSWARDHADELRIDTNRVAGYGVSAGGHLVAAAATLPSVNGQPVPRSARPNAMLLYSPALNTATDEYFARLMKGHGDPPAYSPAAHIDSSLPPALVIQGEKDSIVLATDARDFCASAAAKGARCELHVYPGVGHLLTRNLAVQYKDFDSDPVFAVNARGLEDAFLRSLGYVSE